MHPPIGMILERYVPPGGVSWGKHHFPEGTIVGINAWVTASVTPCPACRLAVGRALLTWRYRRNEEVYGKDCHQFRPERWLEASGDALAAMERANFAVRNPPPASWAVRTCTPKLMLMTVLMSSASLDMARGGASAKILPCWRCASWCRNCFDITRYVIGKNSATFPVPHPDRSPPATTTY